MPIELRIPEAGESITEVRIGSWRKSEGDIVRRDEVVVDIETDKAAIELPAPVTGTLSKILLAEGADATVGDAIALIDEGAGDAPPAEPVVQPKEAAETEPRGEVNVMPAARRVLGEAGIPANEATASGPGGRLLKEDAIRTVEAKRQEERASRSPTESPVPLVSVPPSKEGTGEPGEPGREEEAVPMTPIRKAIARNLVAAQQSAALLTTFNEVDMTNVIELRMRYRDAFRERHGVKLGFMSFFVKASVDALQAVPAVNARIEGSEIIYRKYQDIGIAVGSGRGLVVPVLRNAESMSFAEIERAVADFGSRAQRNKIELSELLGGTFTISNGGIYGSMLSTPIVNPPQSGILGMHAIKDRPVAVDGQVVIRPMMYLALTYDHRIVDGREAVTFLRRIKDLVEDPERIWLQV